MNKSTQLLLTFLLAATRLQALINPNFTPVHLVNQATTIWEVQIEFSEDESALEARTTAALKGEAPAETFTFHFGNNDHFKFDIQEAFAAGKHTAVLLTGDFSGASMGGDDGDADPWAMIKIGARWFMLASADNGALFLRDDPIDLSTVWAGDPANLRQVTEYILADPRAEVPVNSGGRWAPERMLTEIEGTVSGLEAITLGRNPLLMVYRHEGDMIFSPSEDFKDITGSIGLQSHSAHAAWGRFTDGPGLGLMSLDPEGVLHLWTRDPEEFKHTETELTFENATGLATIAKSGRAALLAGTRGGMYLITSDADGSWTREQLTAPEAAGEGGPVYAIDLNQNGKADLIQIHTAGLVVRLANDEAGYAAPQVHPYAEIGTPLSLAVADFSGDGRLDILACGDRGAAMMLNRDDAFASLLDATGELAYNIRPGVNAIGIGDHALDGRVDLMLFNIQLPPQIYFNRGFAVFGYDMELDLMEDVPDALDAAGSGQQAGLLADLTGNGLQEAVFVTHEGELWLLERDTEGLTPLGATLQAPVSVTGPVPVVLRDGQRTLGARIAAPQTPAHVGRRNRGPVQVEWHHPGEANTRSQRVIVLRPELHMLDTESN